MIKTVSHHIKDFIDTNTKVYVLAAIASWSLQDVAVLFSILVSAATLIYVVLNCFEKYQNIKLNHKKLEEAEKEND